MTIDRSVNRWGSNLHHEMFPCFLLHCQLASSWTFKLRAKIQILVCVLVFILSLLSKYTYTRARFKFRSFVLHSRSRNRIVNLVLPGHDCNIRYGQQYKTCDNGTQKLQVNLRHENPGKYILISELNCIFTSKLFIRSHKLIVFNHNVPYLYFFKLYSKLLFNLFRTICLKDCFLRLWFI